MNIYTPIICSFFLLFCTIPNSEKEEIAKTVINKKIEKHPNFNKYWYNGTAEITSYKLSQAKYGEIYEGTAVNIFVTEDFLPKKQVKADSKSNKNIAVLKMNSTKKFLTGIYPYSVMTSTFSPIDINKQAIKVSFSSQEWCGNIFVQLNNKEDFQIDFHSYFETNADQKITLKKHTLENDLWNQIRILPKNLPIGKLQMLPSLEYLGLNHKEIKTYEAITSLDEKEEFIYYSINYPTLKRTLTIKTSKEFPYTIEGWEETTEYHGKMQTTKAKKIKTIQSAYWSKNGVEDISERKELGL